MPEQTPDEPPASTAAPRRSRLGSLAFLARFAAFLAVLYLPLLYTPIDEHMVEPFTRGVAAVSAFSLNMLGQHVVRSGVILSNGTNAVSIRNGCNGLEAMAFLVAATLAFSAPWRSRLAAAAFGIVLVQVLNLIRVVSLFLIQRYRPDLFELFHLAIWQTIIGGASIAFFYVWTRRVVTALDNAPDRG